MNTRLNGLFITHNYGLYGASQSLQLLLNNRNDIDATLIIPMKKVLSRREKTEIAERFGVDQERIRQFFLPWVNCFECRKTDVKTRLIIGLKNLLWKTNRRRLFRFIRSGQFDFIHLNSMVLSEVIRPGYPFIIHIREFLIDDMDRIFHHVKNARGVIFIDDSVVGPFGSVDLKNRVVIGNPVDMRSCERYVDTERSFSGKVVIAMIGRVEADKGIDFVIRAFKKTDRNGLKLVIVGDVGDGSNGSYMAHCRRLAFDDDRIVFWGEEKNISKIYAFTDYIIRGEIDFRMGRSILEALYSGSHVIIPCSEPKMIASNDELVKFRYRTHPYAPRDAAALQVVLSNLSDHRVHDPGFDSNVGDYVKKFNEYVQNTLTST